MAESVRRRLGLAMLAVTAIAGCAANEPADVAVSVPAAEVPRPHAASTSGGVPRQPRSERSTPSTWQLSKEIRHEPSRPP